MTQTAGWLSFFLINRHRIRISILLLSMFFQLGVVILGGTVSLTRDEAGDILSNLPPLPLSWDFITAHNMRVSVFNFLPLFGVWWIGVVGFNTGTVMKAIAVSRYESTTYVFFTIAALPHYWFENFAYSIALTAGLMFLLAISTLKISIIFHEIKCLVVSIAAWAFLLIIAGLLEFVAAFICLILWLIITPLAVPLLEIALEDTIGRSRKAIFLVTLFLYFSLMFPFVTPFPISLYIVLSYYLFENLSHGWLRRQIHKFSSVL